MYGYQQAGFATYADYLASPLWRAVRRKVLKRDGGRCVLCRRKTKTVHHRGYDLQTMLGKDLDKLASLCEKCHKKAHWTRKGLRRDLAGTEKYVRDMLLAKEKREKLASNVPDSKRHKCIGCKKMKAREQNRMCPRCQWIDNEAKGRTQARQQQQPALNDKRRKSIIESITSKPRF